MRQRLLCKSENGINYSENLNFLSMGFNVPKRTVSRDVRGLLVSALLTLIYTKICFWLFHTYTRSPMHICIYIVGTFHTPLKITRNDEMSQVLLEKLQKSSVLKVRQRVTTSTIKWIFHYAVVLLLLFSLSLFWWLPAIIKLVWVLRVNELSTI